VRRLGSAWPVFVRLAALTVFLSGCLSTRLVNLDNLDVPLPEPAPRAGWRADVGALLDRYEHAPVLAPEDQRLEPLVGGLTTLSYFGANAAPRVADQRISRGPRARGQSLEAACVAPTPAAAEAAEVVLATSDLPAFSPVWVPLSTTGGAAPESARCDEQGTPTGADVFCVFGRLALQSAEGRPLVVVVHGLFDSGAQDYVQRMAAALYRLGNSVLVPDMRDHGDTLRAAPAIATTLGMLEGPDLLALVEASRQACGPRIGRAGIAGVSGGALDAIRAFTLDEHSSLDLGVVAISPLLDVPGTIRDVSQTGACAVTRAIELSWLDDLTIAAATGAAFFGGAALVRAVDRQPLDGKTALVGGIGAGAGLLISLAVDAWFDGGAASCVSENAIAQIVEDALRVRWSALRTGFSDTLSPAGRRIEPDAIRLDSYVRERAQFLAARLGLGLRRFDPGTLSRELRSALESGARQDGRLLVIGADDDPMTRVAGFRAFVQQTSSLRQVYARSLRHGGHGAMWIVQPAVMQRVFGRFFGSTDLARAQ
jgi:pimeloyl-ACP methyl ester carboxylesterase